MMPEGWNSLRKKWNKKHNGKLIIVTASIIAMNFLGVSYAYWSDNLGIHTELTTTTGSIDPQFCSQYSVNETKGKGQLSVRLEDPRTMVIEGTVEPGYKAFIDYEVLNKGTVPVKYVNQNDSINNGIHIVVNQSANAIQPNETCNSNKGSSKLHIDANQVGNYKLEFILPFQQWVRE